MQKRNSFDCLIQKALETNDFPPIPTALLQKWQPAGAEKGAKWIWILPSLVFVLGIGVGVELAPLGLSNAFFAMKTAMLSLGQLIPADAWKWALVLFFGVLAFSVESMRSIFTRLK
jgi:hypothetical protein